MEREHKKVSAWMERNGKIKALCTTAFVGTLVQNVGGDSVDVLDIVHGQNDPHSYQLVKGDDEKFRRADVVFSSGLGLEQNAGLSRYLSLYKACAIGDYVAKKTKEAIFIGPTVDPHIWMDISLWAYGATMVALKLSEIRPELSEYFQKRASETIEKFLEVHEKIRKMIQSIPSEKRYLVTTHDAFSYFCRAYLATPDEKRAGTWNGRCMAPEGFSPESQISSQDLNEVVIFILKHNVKEIFSEVGMNQDSLRKVIEVCEDKGRRVVISSDFLYSDTIGPKQTYEEMMEHNANVLYTAFMKVETP
jgi:manganese/zinc/iron transport system substrate-binding protein